MILITGLGPGDISRIPGPVLNILEDPTNRVIIRTRDHPAAEQLAERREITFCDDLYESELTFEAVYDAIASRVLETSDEPVVYAVPGSPLMGEFAVRRILESGADVQVIDAESFVDAILVEVGYDPLERGLQILNGHDMQNPILLDKPTVIGHLDRHEILADVGSGVARALPEGAEVTVFANLGAADVARWTGPADSIPADLAGFRTSIWIDSAPGGLVGAIEVMERLRRECPWDREQTHVSLAKNLVEEAYELIEAIHTLDRADDGDVAPYATVEEELGDVLLQVLFHANIATESGAFDLNDLSEVLRQKLVRRHPHVFGDVEVESAAEVKSNWDRIKAIEKGDTDSSALDGIPLGMPALHRASKIQNRVAKSDLEPPSLTELGKRVVDLVSGTQTDPEIVIGEAIFALVDLSRRRGLDAEMALLAAVKRFEREFRQSENRI